ncbi:MAG: HEPN domain-containing protein [Sulfuricurvum sp.]|jgi:HEPN domain-containing protein|uniref:HEPN domain-containing protein n=1 Tax=Sulfuricurvum sp. TaxID=2025608 RepID=UPI0025E018C0|nr:HEPN domain-containing protein [Sulfuricurvum sp.]MCK9373629.1 HEPN domain-containing protein [Sulfuricurvum sp.]
MSAVLSKEWLKAAYLDLENIRYIVHVPHLSAIVAFHAQQSTEKSLKALLTYRNVDIPKIHALNRLFDLCQNDLSSPDDDIVNLLDSLYIESRYPGDMGLLPYGKPTLEDAQKFYDFAEKLFMDVCALSNTPIDEIKSSN